MVTLLSQLFKLRFLCARLTLDPRPKTGCCLLNVVSENLVDLEQSLHEASLWTKLRNPLDVGRKVHRESHDLCKDLATRINEMIGWNATKSFFHVTKARGDLLLDERKSEDAWMVSLHTSECED